MKQVLLVHNVGLFFHVHHQRYFDSNICLSLSFANINVRNIAWHFDPVLFVLKRREKWSALTTDALKSETMKNHEELLITTLDVYYGYDIFRCIFWTYLYCTISIFLAFENDLHLINTNMRYTSFVVSLQSHLNMGQPPWGPSKTSRCRWVQP